MVLGFTSDDFIAGWIGGVCSLLIGHPLDTIKVRQQTYKLSMVQVMRLTFKNDGPRGFYQGMLFPLCTIGPTSAIFFGVYGNLVHIYAETTSRQNAINSRNVFTAGCIAGYVQTVFSCPIELIKTILQANTSARKKTFERYQIPWQGPYQTFLGVFRNYGVLGLYRGVVPMLIRDVPGSGVYTLTYEIIKNYDNLPNTFFIRDLLAGGLAGVASWIFVIPADVIKNRIQTDNPKDPKYKSMTDCIVQIYQKEGTKAFFRGLPALMLRAFPSNAAIFLGYEVTLKLLQ